MRDADKELKEKGSIGVPAGKPEPNCDYCEMDEFKYGKNFEVNDESDTITSSISKPNSEYHIVIQANTENLAFFQINYCPKCGKKLQ